MQRILLVEGTSLVLALAVAGLRAQRQLPASPPFQVVLSENGFQYVDDKGGIRRPDSVRDAFPSLGAVWVNGNPEGEMHLVWASPGTAAAYRLDHQFADGAVLIKEVLGGAHGQMTTGQANWASDTTKVWFVMIKDKKGRFAGNPLWGDGWGWALFKGDAPNKQVATDYKKDCLPCHQPARATDWVYVKSYPVLTHE
jgi:hypothetical protein